MIKMNRILTVLRQALPIAVGLGSAYLMMLVDIAMIRPLGNGAVAALGVAGFISSLVLAFVMGITPAVQGVVARKIGEGSMTPKCLPLNAGICLALIIGLPVAFSCYLLSPFFVSAISSGPVVTIEAIPYLKALFTAVVAIGINNAFQGYWNGVARVKIYMLITIFINCLNIFLNYVLIFGNLGAPAMGTLGAGIASSVSLYLGMLSYIVVTFYYFRADGFLSVKPGFDLLISIFRIGIPDGVRHFFFTLGYVVLFWIIGQVGTEELAAANVLIRITIIMLVFAHAIGGASATLVSNAIGEGDFAEAGRWGWDSVKIGIASITLLGFPVFLFPEFVLSLFLVDPYVISIATIPLQITAALMGVVSLIHILSYILISVGDGKRILAVSFCTQWLMFLPAIWVAVHYFDSGLLGIWVIQFAYASIGAVITTYFWYDGQWKKIQI